MGKSALGSDVRDEAEIMFWLGVLTAIAVVAIIGGVVIWRTLANNRVTALLGVGGILVSIGVATVTLYMNSSGTSTRQREDDVRSQTKLEGRIEAVEKENRTLKDRQDQVEKLVGLKVIEPKPEVK